MINNIALSRNILISILLIIVCCILSFAAFIVGIEDNPPGIALAFLSTIALVLVFVHSMRTTKQFRFVIYTSGMGFVLSVILHNVFEGIAFKVGETNPVFGVMNGAGVAFFFIALFVCPMAFLIGLIGAGIISKRQRRNKKNPSAA